MSPNQKKALAVFVLFLIVDLVAVGCGLVISGLGGDQLKGVAAGGGAWAILMAIGVPLIALFDFKDDRYAPQPPSGGSHGTQLPHPHPTETHVA
ncbi:hypothetical protein ABZ568_12300 [Streptomyces olindensis]|uniref:Uncharacterized protein n=1 Tax=Streptomyces olindensis TaxID=358823 RepID=A0ABV2XT49_9ACTN